MAGFISADDAARMSPNLVRIINRAAVNNPGLFALNPLTAATLRTPQQQQDYVNKGWSKTMKSKHLTGQAIDVVPINPKTGQPDPNYLEGYNAITAAVYKAAAEEGLPPPTWGGNFKTFKDRPHWEVSQPAPTPDSTTAAQPATTQQPATAQTSYTPEQRRNAIASIESAGAGDYAALGPQVSRHGGAGPSATDRAYGRYQIMGSNLPAWTQAALGKTLTPDQFIADPKAQDAVFDYIFGNYVKKYGEEGAAQAWFGGEGSVGKTDRKDQLGTSVGGYGQRYLKALGGTPTTPAATTTATATPATPTTPTAPAQPQPTDYASALASSLGGASNAYGAATRLSPFTATNTPIPAAARVDEPAVPTVDPQQQQINQQRMQLALQMLNAGRLA